MFTIQVAADIFGNKVNFELSFSNCPSIQELTRSIENAFSVEIAIKRPDNVPLHTFHISKVKIYDEEKNKWVDLLSDTQLIDYCQLYAFQSENQWHKETLKPIPPAVRPPTLPISQRPSGNDTSLMSIDGRGPPAFTHGALALYGGGRSETSSLRHGENFSASTALVTRVNEDASQDEKLRLIFAEFDVHKKRSLDIESFTKGFQKLGLDFSIATVEELFERADHNNDNRISYSEFERFARLYPIMMDCLFYRCKSFWEEAQIQKDIDTEKNAVEKAEYVLDQAMHALESSEQDVVNAEESVRDSEVALRERTDRMQDLARDMESARREKEARLREKKERERDLAAVKEREKALRRVLQERIRESDKLENQAMQLASEAAASDEKVRQLQKALEEAKRVSERAHRAADQARNEAEEARETIKSSELESDAVSHQIPRAEEAVHAVERAVSAVEQDLKTLDSVGKDLGREAEEVARRRDASIRTATDAKEKVAQRSREMDLARQNVLDREKMVKQKEADLHEHQLQRESVTQHERALIEQELRLRTQRDTLEQRESKLMSEAYNFLGNIRSAVPPGKLFSRDSSTL
ncbi:unnamed protein product [Phytomonas sp. EM1]|nr:unnamed protein product [Phytomonas sp. EM1]|eukprot:CCW62221.1 unnamed protein product [Phytomonas sp. isolate EM1]